MKTTIDIPDDLYRRVKAKSSLQGKRIRDLAIELFTRWLESDEESPAEAPDAAMRWLESWEDLADRLMREAPPGPSAREILDDTRDRLEPGAW